MKFLFCFYLFFLPLLSWSQLYNFRNYTVKDGVAQSQVYALLQDSRGLVWMGTRGGGLTRFDGINFKTYSLRDGLGNNYISSIVEDRRHNLWIATNNGISHYNGRSFKNYKLPSLQLTVQKIVIDKKERKWLATNNGVYLFDKNHFINISDKLRIKRGIINKIGRASCRERVCQYV